MVLLQLKRVQLIDIGQAQIIDRTSVTEIMDVILIIEICEAMEHNGDIIVDITEIIGVEKFGNNTRQSARESRKGLNSSLVTGGYTFIAYYLTNYKLPSTRMEVLQYNHT